MLISTKLRAIGISGTLTAAILPLALAGPVYAPRQAPSISWFDCPDSSTMQCAYFDVPRDYSNPAENDTVSIFMRKFPASVSAENRLGSILTNPGGPGGSGSAWIAAVGEEKSKIVEGRYDIIGFDPRGVNLTGPSGCFDSEYKVLQSEYQQRLHGSPFPHSSLTNDRAFVKKLGALQAGHNAACVQNGNHKMLESMGTASVVQDMVKMVEALGEDGLNYWGQSYGSVLGATFAAMRPDLVKRMVLDGVADAESYFNDLLQSGRDNMDDTRKTLTGFLSTCAEAGPEYCDFAIPQGSSNATETTESLRKRLNAIYSRLNDRPMVVADSPIGPGIFKASDLQRSLFGTLYYPSRWRVIAQALAAIEKGDVSAVYSSIYSTYADMRPQSYTDNVFNRSMQRYETGESYHLVFCSDAAPRNLSINSYTEYFREMGKISPVGEHWASVIGACSSWSFPANQRYTGPWTMADGLKKTKFPMLLLSLDADPITPLSSAVKMSRAFGNESAALVIQQGFGHPTVSHPSLCTFKNVRDYFLDGKVPANGTHCTPEPGFIYPSNSTSSKRARLGLDKRDRELFEAFNRLREARSKFHPTSLGL